MKIPIAVLPGDGIGPEVTAATVQLLTDIAPRLELEFVFRSAPVGGAAIDLAGDPLPEETFRVARESRAILLGAVGGPKWDDLEIAKRPERALLRLRSELGLYANLRPVKTYRSLAEASPLKDRMLNDLDLLVIRELTGGVYFGEPRGIVEKEGVRSGFNTMVYSETEVRRIAEVAFNAALKRRRQVTSVDKANVLETSRLWRQVVTEESARFPEVELRHMYVDNCAMQLVIKPSQFDVLLTSNLFGDILSDEAAVLCGSIGMLPSASLGSTIALYEPIHGSAPDIAGQDRANPIATILSAAMLLRHSLDHETAARAIERAVDAVIDAHYATPDIMHAGAVAVGTREMAGLITRQTLAILDSAG
jgi:3-isopropylmalate dehydrogenase